MHCPYQLLGAGNVQHCSQLKTLNNLNLTYGFKGFLNRPSVFVGYMLHSFLLISVLLGNESLAIHAN